MFLWVQSILILLSVCNVGIFAFELFLRRYQFNFWDEKGKLHQCFSQKGVGQGHGI